jgi:hypothetical protein
MSEDALELVGILNDGDDLHVRAALGTHERIDFVHLRKKPCPGALNFIIQVMGADDTQWSEELYTLTVDMWEP